MHVALVLCPSCVGEKVGMNQNDTAVRSNAVCTGQGQAYQWWRVQMYMYMYLLYYYCVNWYRHKNITLIFRLYKLVGNCKQLVYTCHL